MTDTIQKFDFNIDLLKAILWQYDNALRLQTILEGGQAWVNENHVEFWNNWYRDVFNLGTANDFGLAVWSIILGQPIFFPNVGNPDKPTWGYGEYHKNFENGNFVSTDGFTYRLSTESARIVLQLRYFQLTSAGCVPEVNRMLKYVFRNMGTAYLIDAHDMSQIYVFNFPLSSDLRFVFDNYDILPRPAGVESSYSVQVTETWGFDEYHENFDNGNFAEV